jgi:hypothetical protein
MIYRSETGSSYILHYDFNFVAGIAVILLLIVGTGATTILDITHAQSTTLGEPIFVEKGSDVIQKEVGANRSTYTFTSNGTMKGNIEYSSRGVCQCLQG